MSNMMMNFLDLSAASEEERRLIDEILSDTSIVNIAEPKQASNNISNSSRILTLQDRNNLNSKSSNNPDNTKTTTTITSRAATTSSASIKQRSINSNNHQHHNHDHHYHPHHNHQNGINNINTTTSSNSSSDSCSSSNGSNDHISSNNINHYSATTTTTSSHSVVQETTVPPTQAQMPPMQGNINPVISMDMASSQPPGYAMPPPHVTAFGPPPHRMYGGPPIFHQPYYHIIPTHHYNPYMPYVALGPPNNVVPTRHQVPPQTNQPPSTTGATLSSLPRNPTHQQVNSHSVTSVANSSSNAANSSSGSSSSSSSSNIINNKHDIIQHHDTQMSSVPSSNNVADNGDGEMVTKTSYDGLESDFNVHEQSFKTTTKTTSEQPTNASLDKKDNEDCTANQLDVQVTSTSTNINGEEMVKLSSDEGFETQSSLDVSKQSYESSKPLSDQIKVSPKIKDRSSKDQFSQESSNVVKSASNSGHDKNSINNNPSDGSQRAGSDQGVWGSAASKSWASLFKPGSNALLPNGETDQFNISGSENSDEENRAQRLSNSTKLETTNSVNNPSNASQEAAKRALDKMAPRLAQKITSINLKHSLPFLKPRGFINKGNGCYINATLQALIACPPFYNLMKEIGVFRRENSCTPILDSFAELFLNFPPLDTNKKNKLSPSQEQQKFNINYLQAEAIEPKCIYKVLGQIKSEFLKGAQEDAAEYLSSVLNGLHDEMIGLSEILQSNQDSAIQNGHPSDVDELNDDIANDDNLWREVGPKNRSLPIRTAKVINTPILEIFGGSLFSIRTAGKDRCGNRSPFFDLQLDISSDNVKSVQDAIKSFTAPEIIHDFYCTKTKQKLDAQRKTSLDQLPPILILHLKQFVYTQDHGLKKLMKKVEFPIDFELPENCLHDKSSTDKSLRTSRSYKLLAVVYHDGKEAIKGHYLTDVYHIGSSQWIRCDDSNLKVIPSPRVENPDSTRTPYLLFYRRLNTLVRAPTGTHDNKKKL